MGDYPEERVRLLQGRRNEMIDKAIFESQQYSRQQQEAEQDTS